MGISRRNFLQGSLACGASVAALGMLTACAGEPAPSNNGNSEPEAPGYASKVAKTISADVVVVGGGMAGLAAAVACQDEGSSVVVLESQAMLGGNANMISCIMGVDTPQQRAQGIHITPAQIIVDECSQFNYMIDGSRWADLVKKSSANIEWLAKQGVIFSDHIDNYLGSGKVDTAHWFYTDKVANDHTAGYASYVVPMSERVLANGGEIFTETPAKELIMSDEGKVAGIYAEGPEGVIQIDAPVVVMATGGYADNDEMLTNQGLNTDTLQRVAMPGHNGDGINMALAVGALSWLPKSSLMWWICNPNTSAYHKKGMLKTRMLQNPETLWVNDRAVRFADESIFGKVNPWPGNAVIEQEKSFTIYDQRLLETLTEEIQGALLGEVEAGESFKADTIEDLAKQIQIDPAELRKTFDEYTSFCENGEDLIFGKSSKHLNKLEAPFYASQNNGHWIHCTLGGLDTNFDNQVKAAKGGVIDGLYAVGVDGVEIFRGFYTIGVPGGCNANNVNSARLAAAHIKKYLGA